MNFDKNFDNSFLQATSIICANCLYLTRLHRHVGPSGQNINDLNHMGISQGLSAIF